MDVIGAAMLRVTNAHVGGRILLALSLFAPVIGVAGITVSFLADIPIGRLHLG